MRQSPHGGEVGAAADLVDALRLEVLGEFGILDSPDEADFDDLTALAARLCGTPVALVSLLDADRLWFKSRWGTTATEVARETSFCRYTLASPGVLVVPDAQRDDRFRDSPLVTPPGGHRFYAGAPLIMSDGSCVGALCVLDTVPREFRPQQVADLAMVARQVVSQLELRRTAFRLRCEIAATALAEAEVRRSSRLLDEVLAHTDVLVYAKDLDGRFLLANPAMERAVTSARGGVLGRTSAELFPPEAAALFERNDAEALASRSWQVFAEQLTRPDGSVQLFRTTKFPLLDAAGDVYAVAGVSTDVSEVTAVRAGMLESERRFRALFECSPVALALSDEQGRWTHVNAACGRLMGTEPVDLIGRSAREFTHLDDHPLVTQAELDQAAPGGVGQAEVRIVDPTGAVRWSWLSLTPFPGPGGRNWTLGVAQDITARKRVEDELERSAATDPLTGALNRRAWSEQLEQLTGRAAEDGTPLTIALIDLDNFKAFNDTHGHAAGDDLLRDFAADVRQLVGTAGLFARWGGEEFVLALAGDDRSRTEALLQRIGRAVPGVQTCSIGHTRWQPGEMVAACIARADVALYTAKADGRNRVVPG